MAVHSRTKNKVASSQPVTQNASNTNARRALIAASLALIILLGAFLRFYELGSSGVGNAYYAATVQSMLTSWHNFFYAAFEPGGSVTVDKPPLGFWIQGASAYLFGVNGFALALPQALAGLLSIPLLYYLVRRHFGAGAGLIAALVLAVTPVTISTERNNTIDGLLVFVLLLTAWAFMEATQKGKVRFLLLGSFLIGLGFNIKMLQAYMVLPAFYALYFFGAPHKWWKRAAHLAGATVLLLAVSLSWAIAVDLTPADQRPYIGSSKDNTVMELITGHNGISRLISMRRPGRGTGDGSAQPSIGPYPAGGGNPNLLPPGQPPGSFAPGGGQNPLLPGQPPGTSPGQPLGPPLNSPVSGGPNRQGGGFRQEVGEAGFLRLFSQPLDIEASWLLPFALLGIPLILVQAGWRWPLSDKHLGVILWGGWLLPAAIYFTFTSGLFHAYYLIMLGPPMAALVGATFWAIWQFLQRQHWLGWAAAAALSGITLIFQAVMFGRYPEYSPWFIALSIGAWLLGISLLAFFRKARTRLKEGALVLLCLSLIAAPLVWAGLTTLNESPNVWLPRTGPDAGQAGGRQDTTQLSSTQQIILDYLSAESGTQGYLVATLNARQAAPYILATGRPVLTFGGFTGSDNVIEAGELALMVAEGELRFVLVDQSLRGQKPDLAAWVQRQCSIVKVPGLRESAATYPRVAGPGAQEALTLYDCQGLHT